MEHFPTRTEQMVFLFFVFLQARVLINSDLFGLFLLVRDVRFFSVLQSHFQLGGTHVSAHHRGKVSGQQQRALS